MFSLRSRRLFRLLLLVGIAACVGAAARAQTVHAVLLSDLHLDPFHDPARAERLYDADVAAWPAILAEPDSSGRDAAYASLQKLCAGSAIGDTPYPLLVSALSAAHQRMPDARFVTVSGDLIGHTFDCRFRTLLPGHNGSDYRGFVEKTERLVAAELRKAFPGIPIYATLGNNDSDCTDYHLSPGGLFLSDLAPVFVNELARAGSRDRAAALASFTARGDYSLALPAPLQHARILAIDDIYLSSAYMTCSNRPNPDAAQQQMAWLRAQLDEARRLHQQVWVMGHLPPGIDLYSTVTHARDVCAGQPPLTFLKDDALSQTLLSGGGVVRLALFAHTHMDEMRLLQQPGGPATDDVPIKMVSSISPINGNAPSFTLATVQPATATLVNYIVVTASNHTGAETVWSNEYTYARAYGQPAFDGPSLDRLTAKFLADRGAATPESQAYIRNYFAGLGSTLTPLWPAYVCVLTHTTAQGYAACACPAQK